MQRKSSYWGCNAILLPAFPSSGGGDDKGSSARGGTDDWEEIMEGLKMKKVLALLLAVMMLASIGCAWAEETAELITFQGIPWGNNTEEVIALLQQSTPELTIKTNDELLLPVRALCDTQMVQVEYAERAYSVSGNTGIVLSTTLPNVAGYTDVNTELYFVFPVVEGSIVNDKSTEHFYSAKYSFGNGETIYHDLEEKMTAIYGTPFAVDDMRAVFGEPVFTFFSGNTGKQYSDELEYHHSIAWKDANGTIVLLTGTGTYLDREEIKYISIIYFTAEGDKMVSEALDLLTVPAESTADSTDTSGL